MSPSMRRQANQRKHTQQTISKRRDGRSEALRLLKTTNKTLRAISKATSIPKSTVGELKELLSLGNKEGIQRMLNPVQKGRKTVLTTEEEKMIGQRICFSASRGFAIDHAGLKRIMARIAADGRPGWRNGVPSDDAIRAFRARHREITYKRIENKEKAKIRAENREHVETFFTALKEIERSHPGLLQDPNRIWNVDKTSVDATEAAVKKAFCSSKGHNGGYVGKTSSNGPNKHMTAVVAVSASGHKAPPFFLVAGQRIMSNWTTALLGLQDSRTSGQSCPVIRKYFENGWFPNEGVIKMTENGSMEMEILPALMTHIDKAVRSVVPAATSYLLTLDGHSSRNGIEWIEVCKANNCEVIVSPANTSHYLQPCDQNVNKCFKRSLRQFRNELCCSTNLDMRTVGVNLACGVHAFESITVADITKSFKGTGIFPFDPSFPLRFRHTWYEVDSLVEKEMDLINNSSVSSRLPSVRMRQSDKETYADAKKILKRATGPSQAVKDLRLLLSKAETVHDILMGVEKTALENQGVRKRRCREALDGGAPAECVTMGDLLERRRQREAEAIEKRKSKEAEQLRKKQARVARVEEQRRKQAEKALKRSRNAAKKTESLVRARRSRAERSVQRRIKEMEKAERTKVAEQVRDMARSAQCSYKNSLVTQGLGGKKRPGKVCKKSVPRLGSFRIAAEIINNVVRSIPSSSTFVRN